MKNVLLALTVACLSAPASAKGDALSDALAQMQQTARFEAQCHATYSQLPQQLRALGFVAKPGTWLCGPYTAEVTCILNSYTLVVPKGAETFEVHIIAPFKEADAEKEVCKITGAIDVSLLEPSGIKKRIILNRFERAGELLSKAATYKRQLETSILPQPR